MAQKEKEQPQHAAGPARRDERLAAALRANLARRKAQARQRAEQEPKPEPSERQN